MEMASARRDDDRDAAVEEDEVRQRHNRIILSQKS